VLLAYILNIYVATLHTETAGIVLGKLEQSCLFPAVNNALLALLELFQKLDVLCGYVKCVVEGVELIFVDLLRSVEENNEENDQSHNDDNETDSLYFSEEEIKLRWLRLFHSNINLSAIIR